MEGEGEVEHMTVVGSNWTVLVIYPLRRLEGCRRRFVVASEGAKLGNLEVGTVELLG